MSSNVVALFQLPDGYRPLDTGEPMQLGDIRLKRDGAGRLNVWVVVVNTLPGRTVREGEVVGRHILGFCAMAGGCA